MCHMAIFNNRGSVISVGVCLYSLVCLTLIEPNLRPGRTHSKTETRNSLVREEHKRGGIQLISARAITISRAKDGDASRYANSSSMVRGPLFVPTLVALGGVCTSMGRLPLLQHRTRTSVPALYCLILLSAS